MSFNTNQEHFSGSVSYFETVKKKKKLRERKKGSKELCGLSHTFTCLQLEPYLSAKKKNP